MTGDPVPFGFDAWYDRKQADEGDPWHRTLIDPALFEALGPLPGGTRVLDLGCGNGYLARRLARAGAKVVGVDLSPSLVAAARARESAAPLGIEYRLGDAAQLRGLADASFDVAIANMSLMDIERADAAVAEVGRVVRPGGRFVFSISHPCFDVDRRSSWTVEAGEDADEPPRVFRRVTDYRRRHFDDFDWTDERGEVVARTRGYHRPLSWYARVLRSARWVIVDLLEPRPQPDYVGRRVAKEWIESIPLHLVVSARREPDG